MSKDIFEIINPTNTLGVCRPLAHILGACETIVYNALLSKYRYYQKNDMLDDGWFYSTIPDLFESTSFSAFRQKRCITTLESFGLIETKKLLQAALGLLLVNMHIRLPSAVLLSDRKHSSPKAYPSIRVSLKRYCRLSAAFTKTLSRE